ncbi:MAG: VanZ family protein [Muribaculaceae bacterium]|nr:VanZ family protein [Muribaculaceae bacterium]
MAHKIKRFFIDFWPTLLVVAVIAYATLHSNPVTPDMSLVPHMDKLIHAIMMGGLLSAIAFDWQRSHRSHNVLTPRFLWTLFACVVVFSCGDEILQKAMENGRSADILDFAADTAGALIALFTAPPVIRAVLKIPKNNA